MPSVPKYPVPVFPLSGAVLFPGARLPLHVFELRYRTMVRDALSGERMIALALPRQGWKAGDETSGLSSLGCLARLEEVEWLPDDCYDLKLLGLSRVQLERVVREYPYRAARVTLLPQDPLAEDDPLVLLERRALLEAFARAARQVAEAGRQAKAQDPHTAFEPLVNAICMKLEATPSVKMELLRMDSVVDRSRRAREMLEEWLRRPVGGAVGGERN